MVKEDVRMSDVPAKIPESEADLQRAVQLLNLRMKSNLSKGEQSEFKQLVGVFPTPAQAIAWKQAFKRQIAHRVMQG